jgi:tetratricopeptide (TPR) repeat protein
MDDLDKAIGADLDKATQFTNSGAAKPEKTASSVCVWALSDMDALVQRFPTDYRSHMFRGLYFSFFVSFSSEDWIVTRAIENFDKATELNPKSALPQLFKASLLSHPFKMLGRGDAARRKLNAELAGEYAKALALDPNLLLALKGRANANLNLKQLQQAIVDYDRILSSIHRTMEHITIAQWRRWRAATTTVQFQILTLRSNYGPENRRSTTVMRIEQMRT